MAAASILVVDDDAPIRRMLERTLATEGHDVAGARTAEVVSSRSPVEGDAELGRVGGGDAEVGAPDAASRRPPGDGADPALLLGTQFEAWHGFLRVPADWTPVIRALWVCALYIALPVFGAYLVFLRRDVAAE